MSSLFPSQTSTTTSTTTPEGTQRIFDLANTAEGAVPTSPFQGPFTAAANPLQFEGLGLSEEAIRGFLPEPGEAGFGQSTRRFGEDLLSGRFLDPATNPALQGLVAANIRPIEQRRDQVVSELGLGAERFGATGGARQILAESQIESDAANLIGDTRANVLGENFARERNLQLLGPQFLQRSLALEAAPGQALSQLGGQRRALDQISVQEGLAQRNEQVTAPFNFINQLVAALSGQPQGTSATTVTQQDQMLQLMQFLLGAGAIGTAAAA